MVGLVVFLGLLYTPLAFLDVLLVLFVALALLSEGVGGRGMLGVQRRREVFFRQRGVPRREQISAPAAYDDDAWDRARRRRRDEADPPAT